MNYGISSLLGRGLAGALLLGSGCLVMPEGTNDGDDRSGAPRLVLDVSMPSGVVCTVVSGSQDRTCDSAITSPSRAVVAASIEWNGREPGALEVGDDCGGTLAVLSSNPVAFKAEWAPPSEAGACVITARAASKDGVRSELSAVVVVQAGPSQAHTRESRAS
jgi:hypothetical protein